jgi:hypothetical protein
VSHAVITCPVRDNSHSPSRRFAQAQETAYRERLDLFHQEMFEQESSGDVTPSSSQSHTNTFAERRDKMLAESSDTQQVNPTSFTDVLAQSKQRDQWQHSHRARAPIKYRVYIVTQSFVEIGKQMPQLVEATAEGLIRPERDLQLREALESTKLSGASMIADGIWVRRPKLGFASLKGSDNN